MVASFQAKDIGNGMVRCENADNPNEVVEMKASDLEALAQKIYEKHALPIMQSIPEGWGGESMLDAVLEKLDQKLEEDGDEELELTGEMYRAALRDELYWMVLAGLT